ncbi:hypothetical protein BC628DRAFT_1338693 [Trametes gibbosa]|nr:hypothetical protein BC628DRAFT_1338693 [Trametes gibbosa]
MYVLDLGDRVWQFNTRNSPGKVRFKAAKFVQSLVNERESQPDMVVYDGNGQEAGVFLSALDISAVHDPPPASASSSLEYSTALFHLSDSSGEVIFEHVSPPTLSTLSTSDAFVLDDSTNRASPAIYVWLGANTLLAERQLALQYGQWYLYKYARGTGRAAYATHIVKMHEGQETDAFMSAIGA